MTEMYSQGSNAPAYAINQAVGVGISNSARGLDGQAAPPLHITANVLDNALEVTERMLGRMARLLGPHVTMPPPSAPTPAPAVEMGLVLEMRDRAVRLNNLLVLLDENIGRLG